MKVKTVGVQKKEHIKKLLIKSGYEAWMMYRQAHVMFALVIIACNRLYPTKPKLAYWGLLNSLRSMHNGRQSTPKAWKCVERMGSEGVRAAAALAQDKEGLGCKCPVCGGEWEPDLNSVFDHAGNDMNPEACD